VAPGRLADLVILDANPLADIRNTTRIHAVVANGRLIDAAERARLLARAAAEAARAGTAPPARR
jgi:adenine deaminase